MDLHSFIFDFRYFIKSPSDYRWRILNKYLQVSFELNYLKIDYKDFNEFCYKIKELKKKIDTISDLVCLKTIILI